MNILLSLDGSALGSGGKGVSGRYRRGVSLQAGLGRCGTCLFIGTVVFNVVWFGTVRASRRCSETVLANQVAGELVIDTAESSTFLFGGMALGIELTSARRNRARLKI